MATVNSSNINITDLDFDSVEASLKEYLKGPLSSVTGYLFLTVLKFCLRKKTSFLIFAF